MGNDFDKSRFIVRIPVKAPVEKIFESWTTPAGLEHFFLRQASFRSIDEAERKAKDSVQEGDAYLWRWHGYPDSTFEEGEVLEQNGKDRFRFRFGKAGICTVSIFKLDGETIVELLQENIPTDDKGFQNYHIGCKTGWTFYMANLKSMLEGGIDLRNRNEKIGEVISS
ncbi:MAG TPA: SRPBCC domain-containing protein [Chitinophagaceae bacterium]|nr:SRPBCC domain-containing protein [Chitinophagaceae bacterium]